MRRAVARGRVLPQRLSTDPRYGQLSLKAVALYPLMWVNCDDQGRLSGNPAEIKYAVCPNIDHISKIDIPDILKELEANGFIKVYDTPKSQAIQMLDWWQDQKLQWAWPSEYSPPNGWKDRLRYKKGREEVVTQNWGDSPESSPEFSPKHSPEKALPSALDNTPEKENEKEKGKGKGKRNSPESSGERAAARPSHNPLIAKMQQFLGYPGSIATDPVPNPAKEAKFLSKMLARGFSEEEVFACWEGKVKARGEFVSMQWVNEDIGKKGGSGGRRQSQPGRSDAPSGRTERSGTDGGFNIIKSGKD